MQQRHDYLKHYKLTVWTLAVTGTFFLKIHLVLEPWILSAIYLVHVLKREEESKPPAMALLNTGKKQAVCEGQQREAFWEMILLPG